MIRASFLSASIESARKSGTVPPLHGLQSARECKFILLNGDIGGTGPPIGSFVYLNPGIVAAAGIRESQTRAQYISRETFHVESKSAA